MKIAYADPPYFGCGKLYAAHHADALDWDRPQTHLVAARPDDDLNDLFPGTGAVTEAWRTWRGKFTLPPADSVFA